MDGPVPGRSQDVSGSPEATKTDLPSNLHASGDGEEVPAEQEWAQARKALEQLFAAEYSDSFETVLRLGGALIGAGLLFAYTGWLSTLLWATVYVAVHALHFLMMRRAMRAPDLVKVRLMGGFYLVVEVSFLWMPALIAAQNDPILSFAGMLMIAATMVYHIRRADMLLWLVWGQAFVLGVALLSVVAMRWETFEGGLAKFGALLVTAYAILFLTQAMISSRRNRMQMELAAERLAQEQKVSAVGRLAGGVAHDFNNVLTVVLGNLELYSEVQAAKDKDAAVHEAHKAARRAETAVQQLLIYARKAPTQQVRVDCNAMIDDTLALLDPVIPKSVQVETALSLTTMCVIVDKMQFQTALVNLIKNALDAMGPDGTLRIETARVPLENRRKMVDGSILLLGDYVEISIADNGHGIPRPLLPRVTEPFFTTRDPGGASGLGLSMVLGFAHEAGGGLHIESGDHGTTACLYLRAARPV